MENAALFGDTEWCGIQLAALPSDGARRLAALAALRTSCNAPNDEVVAFLLDNGADVENSPYDAMKAFITAVELDDAAVTQRLLDAGLSMGEVRLLLNISSAWD